MAYWPIFASNAELTWPTKTVELHADAKTSVLETRYRFTNDGPTPVDIRQVQTSCGCTTAALEQRHYEPGQSGDIVVRYAVGEHIGLQKKTLWVFASDHPLPTTLTLVVHIPELVRVVPAFVSWRQGEPIAAKTIRVESVQPASPLTDVSVQSSSPAVTAELQPAAGSGKYEIRVATSTTDHPLFATLTIHGHFGAEEKNFRAFASVQKPLPAPPATPSPSPTL